MGTYGVCLFFTISGFLVTLRIFEEIKVQGFFDWKKFMLRRVFRILPPFYLFLIFLVLLSSINFINLSILDFVTSLTFTRIYFNENVSWFTSHIWSLCVEEHFYILLTLIFIVFKRFNFIKIFLVLFCVIVAWNIISFKLQHIDTIKSAADSLRVFSWMSYMFSGALVAAIASFKKKILDFLQKYQLFFLGFLPFLTVAQYPLKLLILPIFFAFTIAVTCLYPIHFSLALFENKVMIFFGKISYSLYIWQQLFFVPSNLLNDHLSKFQMFPLNILLVFIFAIFSYYFIEKPMIKLGRKMIKKS
jgi:peptidoglycan/LPS O-acetylase OafA/YrhL